MDQLYTVLKEVMKKNAPMIAFKVIYVHTFNAWIVDHAVKAGIIQVTDDALQSADQCFLGESLLKK